MTKTTYSTCVPAGHLSYDLSDPKEAAWVAEARADGAVLTDDGEHVYARWCNAHIAVWGTKECRKADIVVDTEHPQYGELATLVFPQDRIPYVVVGGAKSGHYLFVAPVEYQALDIPVAGTHNGFTVNDRTYTTEEALAHHTPERARRITRRKDGHYTDHGTPFSLGVARYRRDWSD